MTRSGLIRVSGAALIALTSMLTSSVHLAAQAADPLTAIQTKLSSSFKVSTLTADRSDLVTVGDVVQLHKPGMIMYAVNSPMPPANSYKNGRIGQGWGGFGKDLAIGMASPDGTTANDYSHRQFVAEEKCFVTSIQVQKDGVVFQLYSDPYNDIRYYGNLKIPFPDKKTVPPADAEYQSVTEVLTVVPQQAQDAPPASPPTSGPAMNAGGADMAQGVTGEYTAPNGARIVLAPDGTFSKIVGNTQGNGKYLATANIVQLIFTSPPSAQILRMQGGNLVDLTTRMTWTRTGDAPGNASPPSAGSSVSTPPLPPIPPPPPPTDTPTPAIALGQTKEQVLTAFGPPQKSAKIGAKEILSYKDMKVTLLNGKVSNVE